MKEKKEKKEKYGIKITYSWGDEEDLCGEFDTENDAFCHACLMAGREAYTYNEEMDEDRTSIIYVDGYTKRIDLHYDHDDTWCYYRIEQIEKGD